MQGKLSQDQQKFICKEFAKLQAHNFKFNPKQFKKVIIIVGTSGVGKSAYAHMLKDTKSVSAIENPQIPNDFILVQKNLTEGQGKIENSSIGNDKNSKTEIPNFYIVGDQNTLIIDSPGFFDSRGPKMDLINSNIMTKMFESVQDIRIHFCIDESHITAKSNLIKSSLGGFLSYFKQTKENLDRVYKATTIIITKRTQMTEITLRKHIEAHIRGFDKQKQSERQFANILSNISIQIKSIPKAQKAQHTFQQTLGKRILSQELSKKFFKIEHNQGFNFSLQNAHCINDMYIQREKNFLQACNVLNQSMKIIFENSKQSKKLVSEKILGLMQQFIKGRDIYEPCEAQILFINKNKQNPLKIKDHLQALSKNFDILSGSDSIKLKNIFILKYQDSFCWPIFFKSMLQANQKFKQHQKKYQEEKKQIQKKYNQQKTQKGIIARIFEWIKGTQNQKKYISQLPVTVFMVNCIQNCIYNYFIKDQPKTNIFIRFVYITWRVLQEMEIIANKKIDVQKKYQQTWRALQIGQINLYHKYYQYIYNYKVINQPSEEYLACSQEVLNLIPENFIPYSQNIANNNKYPIIINKFDKLAYQSKRSYDLIEIRVKSGEISREQKNLIKAIQKYQGARLFLQQRFKAQNNFPLYREKSDDIYHTLGEICIDLQLYQLAIEYLSVFQDNYTIQKCYEVIRNSGQNDEEWYRIRMNQVSFLLKKLEHQKAVSLVSQIYSITYRFKDKAFAKTKRIELKNLEKKIRDQKFSGQQILNVYNSQRLRGSDEKYYAPNETAITKLFGARQQAMRRMLRRNQHINNIIIRNSLNQSLIVPVDDSNIRKLEQT